MNPNVRTGIIDATGRLSVARWHIGEMQQC